MPRSGNCLYRKGTVWYLDFRHCGKQHIIKIGRGISRSVAAEIARIRRASIVRAESGIKKPRNPLFEDACREFMRWAKANLKPRTFVSYQECIQRLLESFHGKRREEISPFALEKHKQRRIAADVRVRVNRELAVGRRLFNLCAIWGLYEGNNPFCAVTRLKEPQQRVQFLEPEEERQLVEAAHSPLKELIVLAVNTGLRVRSEALALRWRDVDFSRKTLTVPAAYAKSGRTRVIPLNAKALEALYALRNRTSGEFVISKTDGSSYRNFQSQFHALVTRVGLAHTGISIHTLRHTFASRLVMADPDLRTVQDLGGWASLAMVQRYAHVASANRVDAVQKLPNFPKLFTTLFTKLLK
ncbi:MAG: site-specific integrase [Nitrospirae bacterium]|nr:MAG: site-specific integrase [Nitrospirota bacterium]